MISNRHQEKEKHVTPPSIDDTAGRIATIEAEIVAASHARASCQADINRRLGNIEGQINELFTMMNNRLPLWATMLIGIMGSIIGWLAK